MIKRRTYTLSLLTLFTLHAPATSALPLGNMHMVYVDNRDGTYTYHFHLNNYGPPLAPSVATPPDHQIWDWRNGRFIPAGGKRLDDDDNIVLFGVDTQRDDITISNITSGFHSDFTGVVENAFSDNDGDEIPNLAIGWVVPDFFTEDQTIQPQETIWFVSFTLSEEVTEFVYWIGGSDDTVIWDVDVLEDEYGIYDVSEDAYITTFLTRSITANKKHRNIRSYNNINRMINGN